MDKINWNEPVNVTDIEMTLFIEYLLSKGK